MKFFLMMYETGDSVYGETYWGDTEQECLDVASQHSGPFTIIEVKNVKFYNEEGE